MTIKIKNKITGYEVVDNSSDVAEKTKSGIKDETIEKETATAEIIQMHEKLERPDMLLGSTYKIKTPQSEHALYITINDVLL
ncbi:MAG: NrdJb, partial [Gammaproteobacteria bacterium]